MNGENPASAQTAPFRRLRPAPAFHHANSKGTGSAVRFELHPAHDDTDGSVFLTIAAQKTVGGREGDRYMNATFDWQNRLCVKLDALDLSQFLQVFRGVRESVNDGKGLFHRTTKASTIIRFEHKIEPSPGYLLNLRRKTGESEPVEYRFLFNTDEAFALCLAIEQAFAYIFLGIPVVRPLIASSAESAK